MYDKIAIVGMAGRFPEAKDLNEFHQNLRDGKDSIRPISKERIKSTTIDSEKDYQLLAFIDEIDKFDHKFFGLSYRDAKNMDPRQRQLMEVTYHAIENAGMSIEQIAGTSTAVFVADTELDYHKHASEFDATLDMGVTASMLPGRISRFFKLKGKSALIDTACSSSLVALESACAELTAKRVDFSIVSSSDLSLFPLEKGFEYDVGILSPDGKCKPFSNNADGIGSGESVISLLVCRLDDAIKKGLPVHAIVKGIAVNQDADMTNGLTAPNPIAQTELLLKAWESADLNPEEISYIETHGTGTKLGDPIEIQAITDAFRQFTTAQHHCPIASIKSNLGHTDSAAGLAGIVKTILQLKHKEIYPSLHFNQPNEYIDFENAPVYVNTELAPWELKANQSRRYAGVSSFGLMGTNCHVILEEATEELSNSDKVKNECLFTLSGKSQEALERNLDELNSFVIENQDVNLSDVAYTLLQNRSSFEHYFVFEANQNNFTNTLKSRSGVYGNVKDEPKVYFSFPAFFEDPIDDYLAELRKDKTFEKIFNPISQFWSEIKYIQSFLFQYAYYHYLETLGVKTTLLLGDGVGKLVISVLRGKQSFDAALELVKNYTPDDENKNLEERLKTLVKNESADQNLLFVEMGPTGNVGRAVMSASKSVSLISLQKTKLKMSQELFKQLYRNNMIKDPSKWSFSFEGKIIELPGYSFEKKRCWIREDIKPETIEIENSAILDDNLLYGLEWIIDASFSSGSKGIPDGNYIIIGDGQGLADKLIYEFNNHSFVKVVNGLKGIISDNHYEVDFNSEEAIRDFIEKQFNEIPLTGLIDLSFYDKLSPINKDNSFLTAPQCLDAPFFWAKALSETMKERQLKWMLVSYKGLLVNDKGMTNPKIMMHDAFIRALSSDFLKLEYHLVDLDTFNIEEAVRTVGIELSNSNSIRRSAYRSGERYIQSLSKNISTGNELNIENGTYIITGGATGVGFAIMKGIAEKIDSGKFIVIGRTRLPERNLWDDYKGENAGILERIQALQSIVNNTIDVAYLSVNLENELDLAAALEPELEGVSSIAGIIHAAGIDGDNQPLESKSLNAIHDTLIPKVNGAINLHNLMWPMPIEFVAYTSSLNVILPHKNSFDYAAANAFIDGLAEIFQQNGQNVKSIGWTGWNEIGMSRESEIDAEYSLFSNEGVDAFFRSIKFGKKNVLVIKGNIEKMGKNPFVAIGNSLQKKEIDLDFFKKKVNEQATLEKLSATEKQILLMFYEVLENEHILIEDDFFDLGGHSLIGTQLTNRVKSVFGIDIEFELLFDYATVKDLSNYIDNQINTNKIDENSDDKEIFTI